MHNPEPGQFWAFSLSVYAEKSVEQACLDLQEQGLNVNLALWIVWTCASNRDPRTSLSEAINRSDVFNKAVVQRLREARQNLKSPPGFIDTGDAETLRQSVLKNELDAERLEQFALEPLSHACPPHDRRNDLKAFTQACLQNYAEAKGRTVETTKFVEHIFLAAEIV